MVLEPLLNFCQIVVFLKVSVATSFFQAVLLYLIFRFCIMENEEEYPSRTELSFKIRIFMIFPIFNQRLARESLNVDMDTRQ